MTDLTGDELARACVDAMYARDVASQNIGITIDAVGEGFARLNMPIKVEMLNGHGICHGGYIFALADTAFAYACNTRNNVNLAQNCSIEYKRPGREGERLIASAEHISQEGRYGHARSRSPTRTIISSPRSRGSPAGSGGVYSIVENTET